MIIKYLELDNYRNYEKLSIKFDKGINILYSDIIYKKEEWQKFTNWRKKVYNRKHGKSSKGD